MNILIVDDSPTNRNLLKLQLESEGFTTVESADGVEALAALERHKIDVVISDILMPNMDGYQLCHRIREMRRFQTLPVIVYTATYTSPDDENLSLKVGADKYLRKPASSQDMAQSIREVVSMKKTHKSRRRKQPKELTVMREYSQVLVRKLEERNQELESATKELARRNEEIQRNLERIRALHEIDLAISSTLDLHTVLDVLLEKINLFTRIPMATTVRLFNRESGTFENTICRNMNEEEWKAGSGRKAGVISGQILATKRPIMIRNIHTDPMRQASEFFRKYGFVSFLGIPLMAKDDLVGILGFYTGEEHEFSSEEIEFLSTLAGQAAIAIQKAQLYEELVRANKVKDEFLSVMSHELRTPLNVVMGYTGMIQDGLFGEINQKQKEALEKVMSRARDQLDLVNNILFATVLEAQQVKVDSAAVSLGDFLNELRPTYEVPLEKGLTVKWDCPSGLPVLKTDSAKLKQILQNLINNAIKFTEKGRVTISVRHFLQANKIEFKVTDTGIGIPEDHLSFIFEKFRQVDSSETRPFGGVGMGLYIVRKFTKLLGGQVEVESELGQGSTFTVTLPLEN